MDHQLHAAHAHRAEFEATNVQHVERDLVAFADFAQKVFDRRAHVGKHERRRARSLDAHLVLFGARGQSRLPFVIHIFSPLRMYSLPSSLKRAVAFAAIASEPEPASVNAYAVINSPAAIFGRYFRFAASVAK